MENPRKSSSWIASRTVATACWTICPPGTECSVVVSSRQPSECRYVWPDALGNCPSAPCRAGSLNSLRGSLRKSATSHRRCPARSPLKRMVTPLQEIDGDVMQQRSEPYTLALSRRSAHGGVRSTRYPGAVSGRGRLAAVPLGGVLPSTASAEGKPSLFGRFSGTITPSEFSSACMFIVRLLVHEPARLARPGTDETSQVPCKELSTCTRSPTARGSSHASHSPWDDVAFSSTE